jgi:DNA-binding response OmpR family regulator
MNDAGLHSTNAKKILIVEDELPFTQIYRDAMHMYGYNVIEAEDGEEGLRMVKVYKPDLVLLDLILPKLNGFDVLQQIKASDELKDIPVIVYSILDDKPNIERAMKLGAVDFTFKGQTPAVEVANKIRAILDPKEK